MRPVPTQGRALPPGATPRRAQTSMKHPLRSASPAVSLWRNGEADKDTLAKLRGRVSPSVGDNRRAE
jgi:hypothetical protein